MTNVIIRNLIDYGYTPDSAYNVCRDHIYCLAEIEDLFNVDLLQSKPNREKYGRLLRESRSESA